MRRRVIIPLQEPQHRPGQPAQEAAPDIQDLGRQLEGLVEAAQDQRVAGQSRLLARAGHGPRTLPVVGLVAARHQGKLLAVMASLVERRDNRVANEIVDVVGAGRTRKTEEGGLHRRRTMGEDAQAVVAGVALQVDQDLDAVGANALCRLAVADLGQVDKASAALEPLTHRAGIFRAVRVQRDLEPTCRKLLEHLRHQVRRRVLVEIGGHEAHTQERVQGTRWQRLQGFHIQSLEPGAGSRDAQMLFRVVGKRGVGEDVCPHARILRQPGRHFAQGCQVCDGMLPAAEFPLDERQQPLCHQVSLGTETEDQRGTAAFGGLVLATQRIERHGEAVVRHGIADIATQRIEQGDNGLLMLARQRQGFAQVAVVLPGQRDMGRHLLPQRRGLLVAVLLLQAQGSDLARYQVIRIEGQRRHRIALREFLVPILHPRMRQIHQVQRILGAASCGAQECGLGAGPIA